MLFLREQQKGGNVIPSEMNNKIEKVLFLWKGTTNSENAIPSERNSEMQKCCSFRKE